LILIVFRHAVRPWDNEAEVDNWHVFDVQEVLHHQLKESVLIGFTEHLTFVRFKRPRLF